MPNNIPGHVFRLLITCLFFWIGRGLIFKWDLWYCQRNGLIKMNTKLLKLLFLVFIISLSLITSPLDGLSKEAWVLASIYLAAIIGLVSKPYPENSLFICIRWRVCCSDGPCICNARSGHRCRSGHLFLSDFIFQFIRWLHYPLWRRGRAHYFCGWL